ncbi:MAG: ATP-binding cassette domain-containing protein [Clostridia bacterium]|nr:ATP-binding cassette domain-containing protein [Clostridia bacterium]MDY2714156.1 ATP-binding cassette domain-containing protein [Christensenellaceae bacterium]MDY3723734.1 ATP-binding cassette domain-containing protein [Christensenellaceae bacterium]
MEYVLRTKSLTKKFGSKIAVNAVDMNVAKGDIYGFIGRNGAGKTTAMKLILGLLNATEGEIELFGGEPLEKARGRIGSLIEAPGIYKNCTAYENMKRFSIIYGGTDEDIAQLLKFVGLENTGNKKAGRFSLGMKQRLGMAIAMLGNPEFLILDEPINGLDPEGIKDVRNAVLNLNEQKGVTFLISSHLLDELAKIVTRYGIINNGVLTEEISAEDLNAMCESGLKVRVDDVGKAITALSPLVPQEEIRVSDGELVLPIDVDAAAVNELLVKGGVRVSELGAMRGDMEEYFIARLGK